MPRPATTPSSPTWSTACSTDTAAAVSTLIEIHGSDEHRQVLAHAIVGMAEGISRHALTDPDGPHDPDQLADWVAELAWFGLRGVRSDD